MFRNLATLVLSLGLAVSLAAEDAGKVARVLPAGFITHETKTNEAKPADPVAWHDIVRTNDKGRMRIGLNDGSILTVGSETEMRIVEHNAESQQSTIELLYGRLRSKVQKITKRGGSFNVRTPTAVIGVIGTEMSIDAHRAAPISVSTVSKEDIERLPRTDIRSLLDLVPGAVPGAEPQQPTLMDYPSVDATVVYGLDGITGAMNIDPAIPQIVFLLPGEAALIERGKPPMKFIFYQDGQPPPRQDFPIGMQQAFFQAFPGCTGPVNLTDQGPNGPKYMVQGRGTSTGDIFEVRVQNPNPSCPLDVFIPYGVVLRPAGLLADMGKVEISDFQMMMADGGAGEIFSVANGFSGGMHLLAPEGEEQATFILRGYCLELNKKPPVPHTEYRFGEADKEVMEQSKRIVATSYRLFHTGKVVSKYNPVAMITQWSLWISREGLSEKEFTKRYTKLTEDNYKARELKFDKKAKELTELVAAEMWENTQKVLAEAK